MAGSVSALTGHLIVSGLAGTTLDPSERRALADGRRAGVVLFKRNVEKDAGTRCFRQVATLNRDVAAAMTEPALVAVDQEGGRVVRLGPPALALPPMRRLGDRGDEALLRRVAEAQARELRALGFTMSFAPVADVHTRPENPVIGDRAFASEPSVVARCAAAWAEGLTAGGLLACAKHFPGHGDTTTDSHFALPRVDRAREALEEIELLPFRALATNPAVPAMMTAHVVFPALADEPATLSYAICTDLLRSKYRFKGVLFSDDLEMKAITLAPGDAAVRSILAGCDVLLVCSRADMADAVHEALTKECEKSPAFTARCGEAAARTLAMRRRVVPVVADDLDAVFAASRAVAAELQQALAAGGAGA